MSRLTPEEFAAKLRAQAELGAEIKRQVRVVTPIEPPPAGPPAESVPHRNPPDQSGKDKTCGVIRPSAWTTPFS